MNAKLKILICAHINWFNAEADYAFRLARGILDRGHQVVIWGKPGSPLIHRAEAAGIPVLTFGNPASLDLSKLRATGRGLRELVLENGFSVVNAHRSEGFPVIARAAASAGAAVVRTRGDMRKPKAALLNRQVYARWTEAVVVANDLLREDLMLSLRLPAWKIRTVRLGIKLEEAQPGLELTDARSEMDLKPGDRVVGLMGRLGPIKGQETLLKAAEQVIAWTPEARFLMIFRDVEQSDKFLPALRRSPLRKRFLLVGPRPCPADVMQLAEVAVIPSVGSEAHCRVALEWMALGVPVIGSRVGVIPELIRHGATGFLVQPRYAETFAQCIIELLQNPERARAMGAAGKQLLLDRFTEPRMVDENLEVFHEALTRKRAQKRRG